MNKIAVCFYGFLRTNKLIYNNLLLNFINPLSPDVFICCPNVFFSLNSYDNIRGQDNPEIVDNKYLYSVFGKKLKTTKIIDPNPQKFKDAVIRKKLPEIERIIIDEGTEYAWEWTGFTYRSLSMFYQFREVLQLATNYENLMKSKYDTIILMRPDLDIKSKTDISGLDLNKVYSSGSHIAPIVGTNRQIGDHLLISKRDNILKLKTLYEDIEKYHREGIRMNNETLIGWHFIKNNIEFEYNNFCDHLLLRG